MLNNVEQCFRYSWRTCRIMGKSYVLFAQWLDTCTRPRSVETNKLSKWGYATLCTSMYQTLMLSPPSTGKSLLYCCPLSTAFVQANMISVAAPPRLCSKSSNCSHWLKIRWRRGTPQEPQMKARCGGRKVAAVANSSSPASRASRRRKKEEGRHEGRRKANEGDPGLELLGLTMHGA